MIKLINFMFNIPGMIFGRFTWWEPVWVTFFSSKRKESPKAFWLSLMTLIIFGAAYVYYENLPKPELVTIKVYAPTITANYKNASPNPLRISFELKGSSTSVAALETMDKELGQHIKISPELKGRWNWQTENTLIFMPAKDWPAGQIYHLEFSAKLFSKRVKLRTNETSFSTPEFKAEIKSMRFYKDPKDPSIRKVVTTLNFTHPINTKDFEKKIFLRVSANEKKNVLAERAYEFTVSYDDNKRQAFIHSAIVSIEKTETFMNLEVTDGLKPIFGPSRTSKVLSDKVVIPSSYTFFRIQSVRGQIVRDEKRQNEPDQALVIEFTDGVKSQDLARNIKAFLLPKKHQSYTNYTWRSPTEVTAEVLSRATVLPLELLPTENIYSNLQSFRFIAPENRFIYIQINSGLKSNGGFNLSMAPGQLIRSPNFPKEAEIAFDGSLMSSASDKKLTLISRGVSAIQIEVGELLPDQINHLISQTNGDIKNPNFISRWNFNAENITRIDSEIQALNFKHPGKAIYSTLDLNKYLHKSKHKSGAFFVQVHGWNAQTKQKIYGVNDKRLIIISDMGLLVKDNADKTHDVFVLSVKQGTPVAGAVVDVIGKNGVPVISAVTSEDGHVSFPKLDDFKGAKTPTAYIVRKAMDTSFIPYNRTTRMINYSRFDVGGIQTRHQIKNGLNAYVFSDRGIYRPGDKVNLAAIVKQKSWGALGAIPLEVIVTSPNGSTVFDKKVELSSAGIFEWTLKTDYVSATGSYTSSVYLVRSNGSRGGIIGSTQFKVEEFQADRMKIKSKIAGDKHRGWYGPNEMTGNVLLENLFGTPAQNRVVKGRIDLIPAAFSFRQYPSFTFIDPLLDKRKRRINIVAPLKDKTTDLYGKTKFLLDLSPYVKGTYRLSFSVQGFEAGGGRSVSSSSSVLVSPVKQLVGVKADGNLSFVHKGSKRSVQLLAVDQDLKQIALTGIRKNIIERRHVSTLVKQPDGTFKYQSILKEITLKSESYTISAQGEQLQLDSQEPGDFVVELINSNGDKLARVFYSVAGNANLTRALEKNAELKVKLNRKSYDAGDLIEIQVVAPYTGAGLITIERDKVYTYKWFKTDKTSSVQTIRIPKQLEGNGYVNVSFIRSADSKEIFSSPLSYSAIPFSVGRERREIKINLDSPTLVKPGEKLSLRYKTSKPAKIILFAVDEGILQVAKYKTPDPLSHFLKKQALEVNTFQIVDLILPEYKLAMDLAASGGGKGFARKAIGKNLNPFKRATDKPIVFWSGILDADQTERVYSFEVPDYFNGSLRLMAVAVSQQAIGATQKSTTVKGPFVISPNTPVVVAPDDEFEVTVGISNNLDDSGEQAKIQVALSPSKHLSVVGKRSKTVVIAEGNESKVSFRLKAKDHLGAASIKFTASFAKNSSKLTSTLSVRPAVPHMVSFVSGYEKSGKETLSPPRQLYADYHDQIAAASHSPLVLVEGLDAYLQNFTHGCVEQMVSKVFPYLGLLNHPHYVVDKKKLSADFEHLIYALRSRQTAQGGFRFWPGQSVSQGIDFPSVYITHFLTDAKELGYPVPSDILRRSVDYLLNIARKPSQSMEAARLRAYAIYIMTRNQVMTGNYLIDLYKELDKEYKGSWQNDITSTYMAASFKMLKNRQLVQKTIHGYQFATQKNYLSSDFDSQLNQDAQYIYLLARHFPSQLADKVNGESFLSIVEPLMKGHYNTLSASYSMLALGAYSKHIKGAANDASITIGGKAKDGKQLAFKVNVKPFAKAMFPVDTQSIQFDAGDNLFYVVSQAGFESELPTAEIREGIEIYRDYYNAKGEVITSAAIGDEIEVRIRVRALDKEMATNVAIIDLLPGGFEILRNSFKTQNVNASWRSFKDIREDRIVIYGDFSTNISQYSYKVKLTAKGDFVVPSIYASSMYNLMLHARSVPARFRVSAGK